MPRGHTGRPEEMPTSCQSLTESQINKIKKDFVSLLTKRHVGCPTMWNMQIRCGQNTDVEFEFMTS